MKKGLLIYSVLLLVMLNGCMHFSRLEARSGDPRVLVASTKGVEKEAGDVLASSNFAPVRDERFEQHRRVDPNFVDEWERRENRGFRYGTEYMSVEMYTEKDFILLVVSSGQGGRRTVVEAIGVSLEKMLHDKFPDLKIHVTSQSYFPFWAP